jgi:hypothetical protein
VSGLESAEILDVFSVSEFSDAAGNKRRRWIRLGVAFPHREGPGMNILLDALPVNGRLFAFARKAQGEDSADSRD